MSAHADGMRGSVKDAPVMVSSPGRCYLRADVGYSWSQDPDVRWTITDPNPGPTQWEFVTDKVTNLRVDNSWFGEAGAGCGSGERGIRGEVMVGFHGKRKIDGEPGVWSPNAPPPVDPLHTSVSTTTIMFNAYYDLGQWAGRFVPYVGAGVGVARNVTDDVYFTGNPALVNRILGDERWSLAWSLMGGVGWQVTDRATFDFGYRYLDMGKAESGNVDTAGFWNPKVRVDDITAHEFKIGLRYALGGDAPCCAMMK
jgi:opacity protein-like surface antigen